MSTDINYEEYNGHFAKNAPTIAGGPSQQRSCNDICCYLTFIAMLVVFIIIGAYMINSKRNVMFSGDTQDAFKDSPSLSQFVSIFDLYYGVIIGCFALSLVLAVIFMVLLKNFPKQMIYTLLVGNALITIAILIFGIYMKSWGLVISMAITLAVYLLVLWCCWQQIKIGIVLTKVSMEFLTAKPSVYMAPLQSLTIGLIILIFWVIAMIAFQYSAMQNSQAGAGTGKETFYTAYFVCMYIFYCYFFHYVMVFIIATACANWYYGINENFCCQGNQRILRYHLGSLTFGALVVTIVALLNSLINQKRRESQGCVQIVWCIVGCCLQCIQALLEVMNHNAVIVMAMTGESYIDSAKTAVGIIFDNYSLFSAVTIISRIIIFGGIVFSTGISTLTGILITYLVYKPTPTPILITYVGLTIFFVSFILVIFAIEMITQALQCVFIFYCFDSKFRALGIHVPNVPQAIKHLMQKNDSVQMKITTGEHFSDKNPMDKY